MIPILGAPTVYTCPNCTSELALDAPSEKPVLHPCRGLKGLMAPMVPAGVNAKIVAHEREDYEGADHGWVRLDGDGRPVMSVTVTRDDGEDCVVYAPTAHIRKDL